MNGFETYFSLKAIVKTLAAMRVKVASRRHVHQMYWSRLQIRERPEEKVPSDELSSLLPPRRMWRRGKKENRRGKAADAVSIDAIVRTVLGMHKAGTLAATPWGARLLAFCDSAREKALRGDVAFSPPRLVLVRKTPGRVETMRDEEEKKNSYRCLSSFGNLLDRVVIGRTAAYLRDTFDPLFSRCSHAFRRSGREFSLHTAVGDLVAFRKRHAGKTLHVADCDIQKFFDVVSHDVVLNAYDSLVERLGADERPVGRAREILRSYLDVYSFPRNLEACEDPAVSDNRKYVARVDEKTLRRLYPKGRLSELRLGIPQGGALSPVLANVVMDAVDRAVTSGADKNLFYARFCDDIVIVHTNRRKCEDAQRRYLKAVKALRLPVHPFEKDVAGKAAYFTAKSKRPVPWKERSEGEASTEWVSFLGHQVRHDGVVRIRKETVEKHAGKLNQEKNGLLKSLRKAKGRYRGACSWRDLFAAFQMRIVALGVGRANLPPGASMTRNWLSVFFPLLNASGPATSQLKRLDWARQDVFRKVKEALKGAWRKERRLGEAASGDGAKGKNADEARRRGGAEKARYFGAPYSYYGSMKRLARPRGAPDSAGRAVSAPDSAGRAVSAPDGAAAAKVADNAAAKTPESVADMAAAPDLSDAIDIETLLALENEVDWEAADMASAMLWEIY